jgi:hypothetical protein
MPSRTFENAPLPEFDEDVATGGQRGEESKTRQKSEDIWIGPEKLGESGPDATAQTFPTSTREEDIPRNGKPSGTSQRNSLIKETKSEGEIHRPPDESDSGPEKVVEEDTDTKVAGPKSIEDFEGLKTTKKGKVIIPFPLKLYFLLEDAEADKEDDIVSFLPGGTAFAVHEETVFVQRILPKYFGTTRMSSFTRQLNLYGFKRISECDSMAGLPHTFDRISGFYHKYFIKGKKDLVQKIKRKKQLTPQDDPSYSPPAKPPPLRPSAGKNVVEAAIQSHSPHLAFREGSGAEIYRGRLMHELVGISHEARDRPLPGFRNLNVIFDSNLANQEAFLSSLLWHSRTQAVPLPSVDAGSSLLPRNIIASLPNPSGTGSGTERTIAALLMGEATSQEDNTLLPSSSPITSLDARQGPLAAAELLFRSRSGPSLGAEGLLRLLNTSAMVNQCDTALQLHALENLSQRPSSIDLAAVSADMMLPSLLRRLVARERLQRQIATNLDLLKNEALAVASMAGTRTSQDDVARAPFEQPSSNMEGNDGSRASRKKRKPKDAR